MSIAALITWVITAGFGFFMLIRWATRGGLRHVAGAETHLPPVGCSRISGWPLPVWSSGSSTNHRQHDAGLDRVCRPRPGCHHRPRHGHAVARMESSHGRRDSRRRCGAARRDASGVDLAEQHIPRPPVVLHGIFAVSTVILVLLTALGIGAS